MAVTVQERILQLLSDGLPHSREEVKACIGDGLASFACMRVHICKARKKLLPQGQTILCEKGYQSKISYRWVRLLAREN